MKYHTWRFNPQILLHVTAKTTITLALMQESDELSFIGFYLMRGDASGRRQLSASKAGIVTKSGFVEEKTVSVEDVELEPSARPYVIIPCTYAPGVEAKFLMTFSCTTEGKVSLEPLQPQHEWEQFSLRGEWKGASAGGCKNFSTCADNPQFEVVVARKTQVHVVLAQSDKDKFDTVGMYVCAGGAAGARLTRIGSDDIVGRAEFQSPREAEWAGSLAPARRYVVVPSTFDPKFESSFTLLVMADSPVRIRPLRPRSDRQWDADGEWLGDSAGGCVNQSTWRLNPQFSVRVKRDMNLKISLTATRDDEDLSFGFYLAHAVDKGQTEVLSLSPDQLVGKGAFAQLKTVAVDVKLPVGRYTLVPCTFLPDRESTFTAAFAPANTAKSSDLKVVPLTRHFGHMRLRGAWRGASAGGCRNFKTWLRNPQACLSLPERAELVAVVSQATADHSLGAYLVRNAAGDGEVSAARKDDIVSKTPFVKDRESVLRAEVDAGSYNVVPCLFEAGQEGDFDLLLFLPPGATAKPLSGLAASAAGAADAADDAKTPAADGGLGVPDARAGSSSASAPSSPQLQAAAKGPRGTDSKGRMSLGRRTPSPAAAANEQPARGSAPADSDSKDRKKKKKDRKHAPLGSVSVKPYSWEIEYSELEILNKIGQGGYGAVFKGSWCGTTVAIKKLLSDSLNEHEMAEFVHEIEIMNMLRHPHVVLFLGACLKEPNICIVTEYLPRGNLAQVLTAEPNLSWRIKLPMARQAAQGVTYLHHQKPMVVHRDLKSLNLLVDDNYQVKVADFGLSKAAVSGNTMNSKVGSLNWCAPEILLHSSPYTDKADVYSFGMVLWELITHKPPFSDYLPLQIVRAIDNDELPPIDDARCPDPDFAQLIRDTWRKDPADRPVFDVILSRLQRMEKALLR